MPGNKIGGLKAAATNRAKHGDDFYKRIGSRGGRRSGIKKGFALNPELAKTAGAKGGSISRRNGVKQGEGERKEFYYDGTPRNVSVQPKKSEAQEKVAKGIFKRLFRRANV